MSGLDHGTPPRGFEKGWASRYLPLSDPLEGLILLIPGDDTGLNACAIEIGFPKIGRYPIRTVEEDLEHTKAPLAAEMEDLIIHNLFLLRFPDRKATEVATHLIRGIPF